MKKPAPSVIRRGISDRRSEESKGWIPSDPIYTEKEWREIAATLEPYTDFVCFKDIAPHISMAAGMYLAGAIAEQADLFGGIKFHSDENKKGLGRIEKVIQTALSYLQVQRQDRVAKKWFRQAAQTLKQQRTYRAIQRAGNITSGNIRTSIEWLDGLGNSPPPPHVMVVLNTAVTAIEEAQKERAKGGRPAKEARWNFINQLYEIWILAKGTRPIVDITDGDEGAGDGYDVKGPFVPFVHKTFAPLMKTLYGKLPEDVLPEDALSVNEVIKTVCWKHYRAMYKNEGV